MMRKAPSDWKQNRNDPATMSDLLSKMVLETCYAVVDVVRELAGHEHMENGEPVWDHQCVLVFLPGAAELAEVYTSLTSKLCKYLDQNWYIPVGRRGGHRKME